MKKRVICALCTVALLLGLVGCGGGGQKPVKLGVSFGVGSALRWDREKVYMEERAAELGVELEAIINRSDEEGTTQFEDCKAMIDGGIDVLILIPRTVHGVADVLDYAREKGVEVIAYARMVVDQPVDLLVGYDSERIGQLLGSYLSELVYEGDYILLKGDPNDNNAVQLYEGAMRYIDPMREEINVILDAAVPDWSPETAKELVKQAVEENGNHVDAILAPNDAIAGACVEALEALGITEPVVITGMDAELEAVRRVAAGTQAVTVYLDLKELAYTAVDQACLIARGQEPETNAELDNGSDTPMAANLITGKLITRENLDKLLIEGGEYTHEEIYG